MFIYHLKTGSHKVLDCTFSAALWESGGIPHAGFTCSLLGLKASGPARKLKPYLNTLFVENVGYNLFVNTSNHPLVYTYI